MIPRPEHRELSIVARFDSEGGIEIEGVAAELRRLSDLLLRGTSESSYSLTVPKPELAAPYDGFLSSMSVMRRGRKARVCRQGDSIRVEGSHEALATLSQNIAFLVEQGAEDRSAVQPHVHVEFYEGHPFLESDSEPLTVSLVPS
jgi:hypothetical protein